MTQQEELELENKILKLISVKSLLAFDLELALNNIDCLSEHSIKRFNNLSDKIKEILQ